MNQSHFDTSMSEYSAFFGGALAFVMSFMSGGDIFEAFIIGAIGYTGAQFAKFIHIELKRRTKK